MSGVQAYHRDRLHLRRFSVRLRGAVGELLPHAFSRRREFCLVLYGSSSRVHDYVINIDKTSPPPPSDRTFPLIFPQHYGGISKGWDHGTIYCSLPTANLVNQQLGVDKKYLHPLPMDEPTVIASKGKPVTVTLLNANHW